MRTNTRFLLPFLVILALVIFGCSGKHKLIAGAPDWVNQGSGAFKDGESSIFYGVGGVTGITSPTLSVQAADQRARADLARQFDTYVGQLYRDYQDSTAATVGEQVVEAQHVDSSLKSLTRVSVRGARIVDHWKDPETNSVYSLARLDLDGVKATLKHMDKMETPLKGFIEDNADRAFEKIRLEEKGK